MNTNQQQFFQLIRYSLHPDAPVPDIHTDKEWEALFEMANKQSIIGILTQGLHRMPKDLQPQLNTQLAWNVPSEYIKDNNIKAYNILHKVKKHLEKDGWECCILKGQGNSLIYPNAYCRSVGDIDVWIRRKGIVQSQDERANAVLTYARKAMGNPDYCYHHVEFEKCEGIDIELHYRPSFMFNLKHNKRLQQWFESHANEQFAHQVETPNGHGSIAIPTRQFNAVFQLSHLANHFFHEGIGLRQLLDYYYQIRTDEQIEIPSELGLNSFLAAVMYILQEVFALEDKYLLIQPDAKSGAFFLKEMMEGGNFGKYDNRILANSRANAVTKNIQRTYRDIRTACYFPSESLSEPVFRFWHYYWRLKHRER